MAQESLPTKRLCIADEKQEPAAEVPQFTRYDEFWFDDGNIVLIAPGDTAVASSSS
ncbi:hypothetical protein C8Q80DRAFT_1187901 [Daedaleopsis nitida]|nr:hypothetical protein C8Q80DRAFT_1187901 [Daedaleopsis nitida]